MANYPHPPTRFQINRLIESLDYSRRMVAAIDAMKAAALTHGIDVEADPNLQSLVGQRAEWLEEGRLITEELDAHGVNYPKEVAR